MAITIKGMYNWMDISEDQVKEHQESSQERMGTK